MLGSISASTSPFLTGELKSTRTRVTRPFTWAPILIWRRGCTAPVACTFSATSPVDTAALTYFAGRGGRCLMRHTTPPATTSASAPAMAPRRSQRRPPSSAASALRSSSVTAVVSLIKISGLSRSKGLELCRKRDRRRQGLFPPRTGCSVYFIRDFIKKGEDQPDDAPSPPQAKGSWAPNRSQGCPPLFVQSM